MTKRRDVHDPTDPAAFRPEQRLSEVAAIVARGVLRLRDHRRANIPGSEKPPESAKTSLELSGQSRPDGQSG